METRERIIEICKYLDETEVVCKRCGVVHSVDKLLISIEGEKRGIKARACCPDCESFIKWLPTAMDIRMPYGKYKDCLINELDLSYVLWMLNNTKMGGSLRKRFEKRLERVKDGDNKRFKPKGGVLVTQLVKNMKKDLQPESKQETIPFPTEKDEI